MKKIIFVIVATFLGLQSFCQIKISIDSVATHKRENVIVCSEVHGIKSLEKMTFINLGIEYPNSPLTIVIFAKDKGNFKHSIESTYNGKNICVTGILQEYKGSPQIIISKADGITIQ